MKVERFANASFAHARMRIQFEYPVDRERLPQSSRATPPREAGCILALRNGG
jgi:hypothetical protein